MLKAKILLGMLVALLSVNIAFAQKDPFTILQDLGPGFYGILLPFVFTFAIIFALLQYTALAKNDIGKRVTVVIAFVAGLFVTALGGPELAAFFINLFGGASIILAGILVILLFVALIGREPKAPHSTVVLAVVIVIGIIIFLMATGTFIDFKIDSQLGSLIFVFIVLIAVAWFLYSADKSSAATGGPQAAPHT